MDAAHHVAQGQVGLALAAEPGHMHKAATRPPWGGPLRQQVHQPVQHMVADKGACGLRYLAGHACPLHATQHGLDGQVGKVGGGPAGLAAAIGKEPVEVNEAPGFVVNKILVPMINEGIDLVYTGVASVEGVDTAMKLGANHPMGPLELADFMGLDVVLAIMNVLYDGLADSKYRPCPLLVKYVEAGWLGRKTGRGFYDYSGDVPVPTR